MKGFQEKLKLRNPGIKIDSPGYDAGKCTCWECLRRDGLTPPQGMRTRFPGKYPYAVFDKQIQGEPVPTMARVSKDEKAESTTEQRHLREAVANREVM